MPRDSNGNYTLPPGNPVVTGTTIESGWANPTMSDIGAELTNSLDRDGRGGMRAPFRFINGTVGAPGITWTAEPSSGFYRAGTSDMRASIAGVDRMRWTGTTVDLWNGTSWISLLNGSAVNVALLNVNNNFTQPQTIVNAAGAWAIWKDSTPTLGGRLAFNLDGTDLVSISRFNGTAWNPKFTASATASGYNNQTHTFGSNAYAPVVGSTRWLGVVGEAGNGVELGIYANDGTNNPRVALFATPTLLGLDWTFSSGITEFAFRRDGAVVFSYDEAGIRLRSKPSAAQTIIWKADDNGMAYWNTTSGTTGFQWYLNSALTLTVTAGTIDFWGQKSVRYWNAANSGYTELQFVADTGGANQLRISSRGAAWHYSATDLTAGDITVQTGDPAPTGGRAGQIVLVYE
jgi:hypothetical protein